MRYNKKINRVDDDLFCRKCNMFVSSGNVRYKIILSITDSTGVVVPILIWNREVVQMIEKSASDLNLKSNEVTNLYIVVDLQILE